MRNFFANLVANWVLAHDVSECNGTEESWKGYLEKIQNCADACRDVSSMFIFGIEGSNRCKDGKCRCYCETVASADGICDIIEHKGYRLYSFIQNTNGKELSSLFPCVCSFLVYVFWITIKLKLFIFH